MADEQPQTWQQKYGPFILKLAGVLAAAAIGALAHWLGVSPAVVEKIVEVPAAVVGDPPSPPPGPGTRGAMGWVRDDDAVRVVSASLPHPVFALTPAGQEEAAPPGRAYLWDAAKKVRGGQHIPPRDQGQVGSCVPHGAVCAVEYSLCVAIATGGDGEFKDLSQEVVYGGCRVQIGGGQIHGDGAVGAWAAQWCQKYGSVARGKYGSIDLTSYSESRCRSWGNSGCPASLIPEAKLHPTKTISQVSTTADAKRALANGYPVTVASDVGFGSRGPYVRNSKGQLKASGVWQHQMCLIGYDSGSGFYCMNSWGSSWVSGPSGPGNPPPGGFYIEEATVARMLSQGDSWAFGDTTGFKTRRLDWFINARPTDLSRKGINGIMSQNPFALEFGRGQESRLDWSEIWRTPCGRPRQERTTGRPRRDDEAVAVRVRVREAGGGRDAEPQTAA